MAEESPAMNVWHHAKQSSTQERDWFNRNFNQEGKPVADVAVTCVGQPEGGDTQHLLMGVTYACFFAFITSIFGHICEREDATPDWFAQEFPDAFGAPNVMVGYMICERVRAWMAANGWEQFSVLEVLYAMGCPGVSLVANAFLSHAQAERWMVTWRVMFEANSMYADNERWCFFLDYMNIRQCLPNDFQPGTVRQVLKGIGLTVVALGPIQAPWALNRVWCVFEIANTVEQNLKILCVPCVAWTGSWMKADGTWPKTRKMLEQLLADGVTVNLETCKARWQEDKDKIMKEIQQGTGIDAMNSIVAENIKDGLEEFLVFADQAWANG